MQLSVVPETGMTKVRFKSSMNYSFKQKLIGFEYFQTISTFNFCLVIPILEPSGKTTLGFKLATSSKNWHLRLTFSYPSLIILNEEVVSIFKGTTGMIISRLLKYIRGRAAYPLRTMSALFIPFGSFELLIYKGSLLMYYPTANGLNETLNYNHYEALRIPLHFYRT